MQHSVGCALKIYQNITEDEVKIAGQITNDLINEAIAEYREILTNPPFSNDADSEEENFCNFIFFLTRTKIDTNNIILTF